MDKQQQDKRPPQDDENQSAQEMSQHFLESDDLPPMLNTVQGKVSRLESDLFYYLQSMVFVMVLVIGVFTFIACLSQVSGHSMDPTLEHGETLLVWTLGYTPVHNDVVIINKISAEILEGQSIVKRVIATGGQRVEIDYQKNLVTVDGTPLEEDYILERMLPIYGEDFTVVDVPEGSIFVMGDNRNHSADSRDSGIGLVLEDYVLGKAIYGIWPLSSWRAIE